MWSEIGDGREPGSGIIVIHRDVGGFRRIQKTDFSICLFASPFYHRSVLFLRSTMFCSLNNFCTFPLPLPSTSTSRFPKNVSRFDAFYQCFMFWAGLMKLNPGFPAVFSTVWRSALGSNGSLADVLLYVKRTFLDGILPNSLVPQIIGGLDVISVEFEPPVLWLDAGAGIRFAFGSWIDLDMLVSVGRSWGEIVARFFLVDPLAMAIDSLAPLVQVGAGVGPTTRPVSLAINKVHLHRRILCKFHQRI